MASPLIRLSHITLQVSNAQKTITDLVTKYRFHPFAARGLDGSSPCQVALKNGGVVFMVNENSQEALKRSSLLYDWPVPIPSVDTACNVCFEVEDVSGLAHRLVDKGCRLLVPPTEIHDDAGSVSYCVVKSLAGNVNHTLIDRSRYGSTFLPGFQLLHGKNDVSASDVTRVDHITYALPRGTTPCVIDWYKRCFGFQHFPLTSGEDPERGFEISGPQIGLRLTSVECPRQNEVGKIVLAESLPQQGTNQIDQFLQHHQEGGIQHAGLSTPDIFKAASVLAQCGVLFAGQPPTYYTNHQKQTEILCAGLMPQNLSQFGILLDSAAEDMELAEKDRRILLQVFAEPLFSKDSFYLELIERRGAQGFGEGNIRALWQSMQEMMEDLTQKQQEGAASH